MNADKRGLLHEELTDKILKCFYAVYNELGYGFLESVYEEALFIALTEAGLKVGRQALLTVWFRGKAIKGFQADLIVEDKVILEIKAVRVFEPAHDAQLLNYLRATEIEVGLLLNFGPKPEFNRLVFDNSRKLRINPGLRTGPEKHGPPASPSS